MAHLPPDHSSSPSEMPDWFRKRDLPTPPPVPPNAAPSGTPVDGPAVPGPMPYPPPPAAPVTREPLWRLILAALLGFLRDRSRQHQGHQHRANHQHPNLRHDQPRHDQRRHDQRRPDQRRKKRHKVDLDGDDSGSDGGSDGGCDGCDPCGGGCGFDLMLVLVPLLKFASGSTARPQSTLTRPGRAGIAAIRAYQRQISPHLPIECRYTPSCSEYGAQAVQRYGLAAGSRLTAERIARCTRDVPRGTTDPLR